MYNIYPKVPFDQYKQSNLEFQEYFSCFAYIFFQRISCFVSSNKKPLLYLQQGFFTQPSPVRDF